MQQSLFHIGLTNSLKAFIISLLLYFIQLIVPRTYGLCFGYHGRQSAHINPQTLTPNTVLAFGYQRLEINEFRKILLLIFIN